MQGPLDPIAVHQQVQMSNRFSERHHHLPGIEFAFEQHGSQIFGNRGHLQTMFLDGEHSILVMIDKFGQALTYAIKR